MPVLYFRLSDDDREVVVENPSCFECGKLINENQVRLHRLSGIYSNHFQIICAVCEEWLKTRENPKPSLACSHGGMFIINPEN
jgi:hypothetical protein